MQQHRQDLWLCKAAPNLRLLRPVWGGPGATLVPGRAVPSVSGRGLSCGNTSCLWPSEMIDEDMGLWEDGESCCNFEPMENIK